MENSGGRARAPADMPPTEFACAVSPLYGETFGAGVTGPTRRLCSKHARVVGRQLSGPKRTELYLSLVQQLCLWRCTLPMAVCVDDNMLMGSDRAQVDAEMESFQEWALDIVGLVFKVAKDQGGAQRIASAKPNHVPAQLPSLQDPPLVEHLTDASESTCQPGRDPGRDLPAGGLPTQPDPFPPCPLCLPQAHAFLTIFSGVGVQPAAQPPFHKDSTSSLSGCCAVC